MEITGIVRRVDEMGRIVLPKDVRKKYGLKKNTPVEFFVDGDCLILRKTSKDSDNSEERNNSFRFRKAIVAGSFDPFTNGHLSIVKKASEMFDETTVAIVANINKRRHYPAEEIAKAIDRTLQENKLVNCKVDVIIRPVAEYCDDNGIRYSVRKLRNNMDFNYENEISEISRLINPNLETIFVQPDDKAIFSSAVRELLQFNLSVKEYVPNAVYKIL